MPSARILSLAVLIAFISPFLPSQEAAETPFINAVMNVASYSDSSVSSGEMVVIFGTGLGPAGLTHLRVGGDGRLVSKLDGIRVLAGGVPCPLIYVSRYQLAAMMPYGISQAARTLIEVEVDGIRSNTYEMRVTPSAPGIFTVNAQGMGQAAMNNSDGTMNSPSTPAKRDHWITFYITGEGQITPSGVDGTIIWKTTTVRLPVKVKIAGYDAELLYAGSAPGNVNGFGQVNAIVPRDLPYGGELPLTVQIGDVTSRSDVTVSVLGPQGPKPGKPAGLSLSALGNGMFRARWQSTGAQASKFFIERSVNGIAFQQIATVAGTEGSFDDQTIGDVESLAYRVQAHNQWGTSSYSDIGTLALPKAPVLSPTRLQSTASSPSEVSLQWKNHGSAGEKIAIESKRSGEADFVEIARIPLSSALKVGQLSASSTYSFRVRAIGANGTSGYSNTTVSTTMEPSPTPPVPVPTVQITLSPTAVSLNGGQSQLFTASVTGSANTGVTWALSPQVGSISSSGLYTAPTTVSNAQSVTVAARSVADTAKSAAATVNLVPPAPVVQITLSPTAVSLNGGQSQSFTASVTGSANTGVTWTLSPQVGSISASGLYTAPTTVSTAQSVTVTARSVADTAKTASATVNLAATQPPAGNEISFWQSQATPATNQVTSDGSPVTLGLQFSSDVPGKVVGLRFYKGPGNVGTHTGNLWSASGVSLGQVTFAGESASGWQQASFPAPIAVEANTTYVASYFSPNGNYAENQFYAWAQMSAGPLRTPGNAPGVYAYGASTSLPSNVWNASNYWVDIAFLPDAGGGTPPPTTYSISGTVSGTSATVSLSGPSSGSTGTNGSGNYTFSGLQSGLYAVVPSRSGYSFSPSSTTVTLGSASVPGVDFTGTVLPPPPRTVTLNWNASPTPNVAGYNIYRSMSAGGPYSKINPSPIAGTGYVDYNVAAGQTYFYVATAVGGGMESMFSNQASAPIN